jgi:hypothetical protein
VFGKITFIAPMADSSLNFPLEIEITNSPSNDLKAECMELPFCFKTTKGIYDGRARNAFVGSVNQILLYRTESQN